jgi:hypothetical protein
MRRKLGARTAIEEAVFSFKDNGCSAGCFGSLGADQHVVKVELRIVVDSHWRSLRTWLMGSATERVPVAGGQVEPRSLSSETGAIFRRAVPLFYWVGQAVGGRRVSR